MDVEPASSSPPAAAAAAAAVALPTIASSPRRFLLYSARCLVSSRGAPGLHPPGGRGAAVLSPEHHLHVGLCVVCKSVDTAGQPAAGRFGSARAEAAGRWLLVACLSV